jgi:hypothetical protein
VPESRAVSPEFDPAVLDSIILEDRGGRAKRIWAVNIHIRQIFTMSGISEKPVWPQAGASDTKGSARLKFF